MIYGCQRHFRIADSETHCVLICSPATDWSIGGVPATIVASVLPGSGATRELYAIVVELYVIALMLPGDLQNVRQFALELQRLADVDGWRVRHVSLTNDVSVIVFHDDLG